MIFTPEERRALLALMALLLLGQLVAIWEEHRRQHPDRELSLWLTRLARARGDSLCEGPADSLLAEFAPADPERTVSLPPVPVGSADDIPPGLLETGRVRINDAGPADLESLPGIGPALARRILEVRARSGPFHRPEDLLRVSGIGPRKLAGLRERIDCAPPRPASAPPFAPAAPRAEERESRGGDCRLPAPASSERVLHAPAPVPASR